jgi:hypothetical protein
MKKEFVPYEQALELKQLGFDEPCFAIWSGFDEVNFSITDKIRLFSSKFNINGTQSSVSYINPTDNRVSAPLYQQAFRWFREKYQIDSCIHRNGGMNIDERGFLPYYEIIIRHKSPELKCVKYSYEEAELECLKKLIEIVKNKK